MPRLSVIIPVYNVAPYLGDCIESLLAQSFADFEVLLVDDGSTDGSGAICDEFAQKDPRVAVFHQKNGGVCSARNRGIDHAKGEFIVFVDSDDLVSEDHLSHIMESDADMVVTGVYKFGSRQGTSVPARRDDFGIDGLAAHWNTPPEMNFLYCYPVAKRFRASIIQKHGIRFDESLFFSEDMCFNMKYYSHAESFTELPFVDYGYRLFCITRDEKYRMSAFQLKTHFECFEKCQKQLNKRVGDNALFFVQENTHLRLVRKFFTYLQHCKSVNDFSHNIEYFRAQKWSKHLLSLLKGKREKRFMQEAVRFPALTYIIEVRLRDHFIK